MALRIPALPRSPIGFAHRGARAHAPENTLEAFDLAVRLGATGLESDVWLTADGVPVLDHDGRFRHGLRRRSVTEMTVEELPPHVPTFAQLLERGHDVPISLDVKDEGAFGPTLAVAREHGAADRVWFCHHDWRVVAGWRSSGTDFRLVDSTRIGRIKEGPERRAATLRDAGVDCVNMHHTDWTAGLVALFHRFGLRCFGWDAQQPRILASLLATGVDGVFSDHVDRMMEAIAARLS